MAEGIVTFSTDNRKVKTAFWFHEFSKRLYKPPRVLIDHNKRRTFEI